MRFFPVVSTLASLAAIAAAKDCWIGPGYEETAFQKCMEPKVQACPYGADGRTDKDCGVAASEECGKSNNRLPHMMRAIRWPCEFRCAD